MSDKTSTFKIATEETAPRPPDDLDGSSDPSSGRGAPVNRAVLQRSMLRRTKIFAGCAVLIGAIASACFMYVGISNTKSDEVEQFDRRAEELVHEIQGSWQDYETAGLWIHEACRNRNASRQEFRALYEYLSSGGLDFQAAEWIPRVEQDERVMYEQTNLKFYEDNYPEVLPYVGLRGLEPDPEDPDTLSMQLRSEQPFYYPVSYVEPVLPNAAAIDFDLYSSASRRATIEAALSTYQPTLTRRLRLVQETDPSAYSVLLMHPGIPLQSEGSTPSARDLSLMVIRIPSLLERSVRNVQDANKAVYVYDATEAESQGDGQFLGAIHVDGSGQIFSLPEMDYTAFASQYSDRRDFLYQDSLFIGSSQWTIAVVAMEDSGHETEVIFIIVGGCVLFSASVCLAVWMVQNVKRTIKMQQVVEQAEAERRIVSSLFPSNVRDRLISDAATASKRNGRRSDSGKTTPGKTSSLAGVYGSKPIADLFPNVSIMFADLVGFTSWASARDPTQVFTLLESTYHAFDKISESLGIFKVETVGDCYVAASGMPEARDDHAEVMAIFASKCLEAMSKVARDLERILGPDTGDIQIRVGIHTGQVTAGVLRGLKGRFQLFGDAVNTASRMESTGEHGRIHVSQEFAELLRARGKGDWLKPRLDSVNIKGKGILQTFWLEPEKETSNHASSRTVTFSRKPQGNSDVEHSNNRLVNWNVQVMTDLLKKIVAQRSDNGAGMQINDYSIDSTAIQAKSPIEEVKEMIALPPYRNAATSSELDNVELEPAVVAELERFVKALAACYCQENAFHNFEHASHVTMSVIKLLKRIVNPPGSSEYDAEAIHDATFGISSDPLTHFACIFAALVHDCDHPGVPNATLVSESAVMARAYTNISVAEQNSLDMAWALFTSEEFRNLRTCVCGNRKEFLRFRQLLVNIVMATDVMDKDLNAARRSRWERVFSETTNSVHEEELVHLKATIVLEHLMQASDVAHTMQHWHIYAKWNERLFMEMYAAYKAGRLEKDPSVDWYQGEIGFLDFYVIPLAKKLEMCGVFGVSSSEYLNYAAANRKMWVTKGNELVSKYLKKYEETYGEN